MPLTRPMITPGLTGKCWTSLAFEQEQKGTVVLARELLFADNAALATYKEEAPSDS
ncbi:hypothetical protein DPMN_144462 [Dreissena polymorpha]|uniref:Uncharacterized protein n=1 Tax=Dreissena polymorpha TaxID=45954 RepID=A0A9D4GIY5_DREPO|nr:hypothetical protein DPMN_144462 [Dreissena polymorpha]